MQAKILGTGGYTPERVLSNAELESLVETSDEWIRQRTGISKRHVLNEERESVAGMAHQAALQALANAKVAASEVGMIIVATCTADYIFPSTAVFVQNKLGIAGCPAFDISAACAGFIYALSLAEQYIKSGQIKYALVIGAEAMSRLIDWRDRTTCVLFGDGAGAVLLGASSEPGIIASHLHADGSKWQDLYAKKVYPSQSGRRQDEEFVFMEGRKVFKMAVNTLQDIIEETITAHGFSAQEIDWLIPHQANIRIIQALAEKLAISMDKVILTVGEHANTSAASIPLALHHAVAEGKIKPGQLLLMEAFGAGLAWGSALVRY